MSTLYVTEYSSVTTDRIPIPQEPALAKQTVAIGASAANSASFTDNTRFVRIHTDSICSITFGASPTATASDARLAANQTEYFAVPAGGAFQVSVITNT